VNTEVIHLSTLKYLADFTCRIQFQSAYMAAKLFILKHTMSHFDGLELNRSNNDWTSTSLIPKSTLQSFKAVLSDFIPVQHMFVRATLKPFFLNHFFPSAFTRNFPSEVLHSFYISSYRLMSRICFECVSQCLWIFSSQHTLELMSKTFICTHFQLWLNFVVKFTHYMLWM
jgi:hypothetical protein